LQWNLGDHGWQWGLVLQVHVQGSKWKTIPCTRKNIQQQWVQLVCGCETAWEPQPCKDMKTFDILCPLICDDSEPRFSFQLLISVLGWVECVQKAKLLSDTFHKPWLIFDQRYWHLQRLFSEFVLGLEIVTDARVVTSKWSSKSTLKFTLKAAIFMFPADYGHEGEMIVVTDFGVVRFSLLGSNRKVHRSFSSLPGREMRPWPNFRAEFTL
jgi:hypothetical protein